MIRTFVHNIDHLECFVNIESQPDGVAEEEDEDDGEEERHHGGVAPVRVADVVVDRRVAETRNVPGSSHMYNQTEGRKY